MSNLYKNCPLYLLAVITCAAAKAAEGDIVTTPSYQLGLPDENYVSVDGMITNGMGTSQDTANIINTLKESLHYGDPNDLMHWYVTSPTEEQTVKCSGNSFRLTYGGSDGSKSAAVMVVWLPAAASEITVSFETYSKALCMSVYTYDYENDSMMLHYAENNIFENPHAPKTSYNFTETITSNNVVGSFTGNYLILMFNTTKKEKTWIDINGAGVSFVPVVTSDEFEINPFNLDVGDNIIVEHEPTIPEPTVPEPTTATLGLVALCALVRRRRRR